MLTTKSGIKVIRRVHTADGLVDIDDLTPEDKAKAATAILTVWVGELYRGKAAFTAEVDNPSVSARR